MLLPPGRSKPYLRDRCLGHVSRWEGGSVLKAFIRIECDVWASGGGEIVSLMERSNCSANFEQKFCGEDAIQQRLGPN